MNLMYAEYETFLNCLREKLRQGGLNKKEIQLNLCNIFSIFISNEFYLFA